MLWVFKVIIMWKDEIKKAEYGQPDDEDYFDKLGRLQNMIQDSILFAKSLKEDELKELIAHLSEAEDMVLELTDNLM